MTNFETRPSPAAPAQDVRELARGEHLLLLGFRSIALGAGDCPMLRRAFCGVLGCEGDLTLCNLFAFVRVLGGEAAERLSLHSPGCVGLSDDERRILAVLAAAQASLEATDDAPLRRELCALLRTAPPESCLFAAQAVAAAMTLRGLSLPMRAVSPASTSAAPTLH